MRTLTYVGALERLEAKYVFQSISACSAGSLVGAVLATGCSLETVKQKLRATSLQALIEHPVLPKPFLFLAGWVWPFAKYDNAGIVAFVRSLIGEGVAFKDLTIPFAMPAIDLATKRLLVFSEQEHPEMLVEEAVKIATGVFPLYPPYILREEGRLIVDAAIATQCPVWMVGRFDDEYPIVVLRTTTRSPDTPPRWISGFLQEMIEASSICEDQHLIDQIPRVREIAIDVSDYRFDEFAKADRCKDQLFERGRRAADQFLAKRQSFGTRSSTPPDLLSPASAAAQTAAAMMEGFANRLSVLSRKKIFISYSHQDREWMTAIKSALSPYVSSNLWDDSAIQPGDVWAEEIDAALAQTRIALLLVSKGFLSSSYILNSELPYFLQKAEHYSVQVRWLLLSDLSGVENPLASLQASHDTRKPLDQLSPVELVNQLASIGKDLSLLMKRPSDLGRAPV